MDQTTATVVALTSDQIAALAAAGVPTQIMTTTQSEVIGTTSVSSHTTTEMPVLASTQIGAISSVAAQPITATNIGDMVRQAHSDYKTKQKIVDELTIGLNIAKDEVKAAATTLTTLISNARSELKILETDMLSSLRNLSLELEKGAKADLNIIESRLNTSVHYLEEEAIELDTDAKSFWQRLFTKK